MKKIISKLGAMCLLLTLVFALTACGAKEKLFTFDSGFTALLDTSFKVSDEENPKWKYLLDSQEKALFVTYDTFTDIQRTLKTDPVTFTVQDYASAFITINGLVGSQVDTNQENGIISTTYEREGFYFYVTFQKTSDAFWVCQFTCEADKKDDYIEKFKGWAATVYCPTNLESVN